MNITTDYHMHTNFSGDCNIPMQTMIESAIQKGLTEIAITDHVDIDDPDPTIDFTVDYQSYMETFLPLKESYQDQINLRLGVEIGLQTHIESIIKRMLASYPFDFVIGSVHTVDHMGLYTPAYHQGKSQAEAYQRYFESALSCAQMTDCYDVFGHIDYINRYGNYANKNLDYYDYQTEIDAIFQVIIQAGKGIEINSSGFRYGLDQSHPQFEGLKRYFELGGTIYTVGSDAHRPEDIAADFDIIQTYLDQLHAPPVSLFKGRIRS